MGLCSNRWGVEEARAPHLGVLGSLPAEEARAASVPASEGPLLEAVHSDASGCDVGRRFLYRGSLDWRWVGHILRVVFIHLRSRRAYFAGCTPQPDSQWMRQQARNFSLVVAENTAAPSYLIHDQDAAFFPLDEVLRSTGIKIIKTPSQSPMCNAYAERFVRETRETLDNLILLGEQHFRHVLRQIDHHHNRQRPYQGLGNVVPLGFEYPDQPASLAIVRCDAMLGGLLDHYSAERVAA